MGKGHNLSLVSRTPTYSTVYTIHIQLLCHRKQPDGTLHQMHRETQWQGLVLSAMFYDHADLSSSLLLFENIDTSHPFTNFQKSTEFSTLQQSLLLPYSNHYFHFSGGKFNLEVLLREIVSIPPNSDTAGMRSLDSKHPFHQFHHYQLYLLCFLGWKHI